MPKYTIPKQKKTNGSTHEEVAVAVDSAPRAYLPANKEIIDSLEVGKSTKIVLEGKIISFSMSKKESSFDVEVTSVEVYGKNTFEELSREDEE